MSEVFVKKLNEAKKEFQNKKIELIIDALLKSDPKEILGKSCCLLYKRDDYVEIITELLDRIKVLNLGFVGHKIDERKPISEKQKAKKAYYDRASGEFRIPTFDIFLACPIVSGGDLKIEISLTMEDLRHLVLSCQEVNPKIHSCEFHWKAH
ncbi:hypothetical protein YY89_08210 [Campylobacter fetus]|nr:hypothetical protein [Campylobacter fetus]